MASWQRKDFDVRDSRQSHDPDSCADRLGEWSCCLMLLPLDWLACCGSCALLALACAGIALAIVAAVR